MTEKIKILLVKRKISLKELSEKLKCTSQNLSNKLRRDNFSESELREIAEALNCTLDISFVMNDTGEKV